MKHAYYMSRDLDALEAVQDELAKEGLEHDQLHVLSDDDAAVEQHDLRPVNAFLRTDMIRSMVIGLAVGVGAALLIAATPWLLGITSPIAQVIVFFACLLVIGFSTWEGGLWGIQASNHKYARIESEIHEGQHLLIVDYDKQREFQSLRRVQRRHPELEPLQL